MKCFVELPCENVQDISAEIYQYIKDKTEILYTTKYGWHFIDCKELLNSAPKLFEYFKQTKLLPRHAAVTIVTESYHLSRHVDELPVVAKINFPVLNTEGWVNRWFDGDTVVAELLDMNLPVVFNSQISHSVEKTTAIKVPRLVASFTFYNEPLQWLK